MPPLKLGSVNTVSPALTRPPGACSAVTECSDEVCSRVEDECCEVKLEKFCWLDVCCEIVPSKPCAAKSRTDELVCPQLDSCLGFSSLPNLVPKSDIVNPVLLPLALAEGLAFF